MSASRRFATSTRCLKCAKSRHSIASAKLASPPEPKVPIFPQFGLSRPQWTRRLSNTTHDAAQRQGARGGASRGRRDAHHWRHRQSSHHDHTVGSFGLDGRAAEAALDAVGITTEQAGHPRRSAAALYVRADCASGTPACTTRGMNENDMASIALWIVRTLRRPEDAKTIEATRAEVRRTCLEHPVPGLSQASAGGMRRSGA
jgi:hypothetical protein